MATTGDLLDSFRERFPAWRFGRTDILSNSGPGGTLYWARKGGALLSAFTLEGLERQVCEAEDV